MQLPIVWLSYLLNDIMNAEFKNNNQIQQLRKKEFIIHERLAHKLCRYLDFNINKILDLVWWYKVCCTQTQYSNISIGCWTFILNYQIGWR